MNIPAAGRSGISDKKELIQYGDGELPNKHYIRKGE